MRTTETAGNKDAEAEGEANDVKGSDGSDGEQDPTDELPPVTEENEPGLKELDVALGEVRSILHQSKEKPSMQKKTKKASQPKKQTPGLRHRHRNQTFPKGPFKISATKPNGKRKPTCWSQ